MADILLINPDQMDIDLLRFICKMEDCRLVIAGSAEEALDKMTADYFDLVVCDYQLPGMNGLEFFRRLTAEPGTFIKVLISESLTPEIIDTAFEIGIHECLRKPLTYSRLEPILSMIGWKTEKERQ